MNVSLTDSNGDYRSTYDIIKDIADQWDRMSSMQKAALATEIAGTRMQAVFYSLVEQFQEAEGAMEKMSEANGVLTSSYEEYMQSIQAHINQFRAVLAEISSDLFTRDLLNFFIDMGAGVLNVVAGIERLIRSLGGVKTLLLAIATVTNKGIISFATREGGTLWRIGETIGKFQYGFNQARVAGTGFFGSIASGAASAINPITAVLGVITAVVAAVSAVRAAEEKRRQSVIDNGAAATETSQEIISLSNQYAIVEQRLKDNTATYEEYLDVKSQLIKALGGEEKALAGVGDEYMSLSDKIKRATVDELFDNLRDQVLAANQAREDLRKYMQGYDVRDISGQYVVGTKGISFNTMSGESAAGNASALSVLRRAGYATGNTVSRPDYTAGDIDSATRALGEYRNMLSLLGKSGLDTTEVYAKLNNEFNELNKYVSEYRDTLSNANKTLVAATALEQLQGKSIPQTKNGFRELRGEIIEAVKGSGQFIGEMSGVEAAVDSYLIEIKELSGFYNDASQTEGEWRDSLGREKQDVGDLAETLKTLKSKYDLIARAKEDMKDGGGLSNETIQAFASDDEDGYLEYLYEENGLIKLNIEAYKEKALLQANNNLIGIEQDIEKLKEERAEIEKQIEAWVKMSYVVDDGIDPIGAIGELRTRLADNSVAIEEATGKLLKYKAAIDAVNDAAYDGETHITDYKSALENVAKVSDYIDKLGDSLTTLADIQEAVGKSFDMPIEKALEFAKVYPEILDAASVTADGQIRLNEDVVNAFIDGKQAELVANTEAQIQQLEIDRDVNKAKRDFLAAQLEAVQAAVQTQSVVEIAHAKQRIAIANDILRVLIENGIDEADANAAMAQAMSTNFSEIDRVVADVCTDMDGNFNDAAYSAAHGIYINMDAAKDTMVSFTKQVHEAATALKAAYAGEVAGTSDKYAGSDGARKQAYEARKAGILAAEKFYDDTVDYIGTHATAEEARVALRVAENVLRGNKYTISNVAGDFGGLKFDYEGKSLTVPEFIEALTFDIQDLDNSIDSTTGQISALRALLNMLETNGLGPFSTSSKEASKTSSSNSGSGSGSDSSSSSDVYNWFKEQYAEHNHLVDVNKETELEYLTWLNEAYKRAYDENLITLDEWYRYNEEVYNGLQNLFKEYLSDMEHEISLRENYEGDFKKIYDMYGQLLKDVKAELKAAYAAGLTDADDYVQSLLDKYESYKESRKKIEEDATKAAKDAVDDLVEYRVKMLQQELKNQQDSLKDRLSKLKEFYDEQKNLLKQQEDEDSYLKEQQKKRKAVTDLQLQLTQLENDDSAKAKKKRLELLEDLADAQDELNEFEHDRSIKLAEEALDEQYKLQEESINKQIDKLEEQENDTNALYKQALKDVRNGSVDLYNEMLEYNKTYGLIQWLLRKVICVVYHTYMLGHPKAHYQFIWCESRNNRWDERMSNLNARNNG